MPNELLVRVARGPATLMPAYIVAASTNLENLEPLEFTQRLAVLAPRRRLHLI